MYKLIAILVAVIPIILFLRTVFGRSQVMKQASADLRRHVDYMVWAILIIVACAIVYSVASLILPMWK